MKFISSTLPHLEKSRLCDRARRKSPQEAHSLLFHGRHVTKKIYLIREFVNEIFVEKRSEKWEGTYNIVKRY